MVKTLVIDNFHGSMTPYLEGDINSGKAYINEVSGYDPFIDPGNLTWSESAVQIDPTGNVITDLILAGKVRVESGITYVYCIGHTGRLYKIQVNDPTTYNPDYDNPVLLATLTINSPTFTRGGFIDFFGTTQRIYIGHDKGVTRIDFNGATETFVGLIGSWIQTVPRPLRQFVGKMYIGNGNNLAEIDSTGTVTTYAKLSPSFPNNTQTRDLRATPDGLYLQAIVTQQELGDITLTTPLTQNICPDDSFMFKWNGTDAGYTSFITYPGTTLTALLMFGDKQYVFGYDTLGTAVFNPIEKMLTSSASSVFGEAPFPNAIFPMSNTLSWVTNLSYLGNLTLIFSQFGTVSNYEIESGYWSPYFQYAQGAETDVIHVPFMLPVSNYVQGASSNGYVRNIFGTPKAYFSTLESSSAPTTKYKLYKWQTSSIGLGDTLVDFTAVYQTQNQVFKKKAKISEVRVYGKPWVTGNAFSVELIGGDGEVITGSTKSFTAGTNLTIGEDFCWYAPQIEPVYSMGFRIFNEGLVNHTITKVEIDFSEGGK